MHSTFEESHSPGASVHLLLPVLSYDDLRAPPAPPHTIDGEKTIGRNEPGFSDGFMSSRHARVVVDKKKGTARLEDLGSRNGVFVGGRRVARADLSDGDAIEIGHSLFVYRRTTPRVATLIGAGNVGIGPTPSRCPDVVDLAERVSLIARASEPVLILGPAASGKSTLAARIHALGGPGRPCVSYDGVGALGPSLEAARGGALIIEEITHFSPDLQGELLRKIEEAKAHARVMFTSHRDPFVEEGLVRADLLHRLASFVLRVPSLSARREDLGALGGASLTEFQGPVSISVPAARALFLGPLPGNLRQLMSALVSAARLAQGQMIEPAHLPASIAPLIEAEASVPAPDTVDAVASLSVTREGKLYALRLGAHAARLADMQGLRFIDALVAKPNVEIHVLDLVGVDAPIDAGDHGEALDQAAIKAYKRKLSELEAEIEEAEANGQRAVALARREEREAIVDELGRGTGLGGKPRRGGRAAERARVNVAMRIKTALSKIAELSPPIAHHLEAHLKTGVACVYRPPGAG